MIDRIMNLIYPENEKVRTADPQESIGQNVTDILTRMEEHGIKINISEDKKIFDSISLELNEGDNVNSKNIESAAMNPPEAKVSSYIKLNAEMKENPAQDNSQNVQQTVEGPDNSTKQKTGVNVVPQSFLTVGAPEPKVDSKTADNAENRSGHKKTL